MRWAAIFPSRARHCNAADRAAGWRSGSAERQGNLRPGLRDRQI